MHDVALLGAVSPHARKTVGLQFEIDGEMIAFVRILLRQALHARLDAQQLLHVMAKLVGDHVGLREIAGTAADLLQIIPEGKVDVDLLVFRAIERPGCGLCGAAA